LTTANEGMLTEETFLNVMLAAQIKLGNVTAKLLPFALILTIEVMLPTWVSKVFKWLLLSISIVSTVAKLIPERELRKVLLTVKLFAVEMVDGKVRVDRAGRAWKRMEPVVFKSVNWRVDRRVKLFNSKAPPIVAIEELVKDVRALALKTVKSPVISEGPLISRTPEAEGPTRTLPLMVEQDASWVASACELMVAVDCVQIAEVCAAAMPTMAEATRRFLVNIVMGIMLLQSLFGWWFWFC